MKVVSNIQATIIKRIGADQGRNSEVFLAFDPQLNDNVVLKHLPISRFSSPDEYFLEAQILYANRSPRIVPVQYACWDHDCIRIAMPYFPAGSLEDTMNLRHLTIREILRWTDQMLTGLHYVHSNGFIHFDIKPSNILVHQDGSVALTDFGQARKTDLLGVADTPPIYWTLWPPEIFSNTKVTNLADMYQVGVALYRMCNGDDVFQAQIPASITELQRLTINGKFPDRNIFPAHIPKRLKTIIRKLLNVNPALRYRSIVDIQNALGQVNTLLDWEYSISGRKTLWQYSTYSHHYLIELSSTSSTNWIICGYSINRTSGNRRKKNPWCAGPFKTQRLAEKAAEEIFRKMEG